MIHVFTRRCEKVYGKATISIDDRAYMINRFKPRLERISSTFWQNLGQRGTRYLFRVISTSLFVKPGRGLSMHLSLWYWTRSNTDYTNFNNRKSKNSSMINPNRTSTTREHKSTVQTTKQSSELYFPINRIPEPPLRSEATTAASAIKQIHPSLDNYQILLKENSLVLFSRNPLRNRRSP